jgi:hypothetical protein
MSWAGPTAVVGKTVSSPYYNPGTVINSGTGAVIQKAAGPALPAPGTNPQAANNNSGGGGGGGNSGSLREQMQKGLVPWDDNALAKAEASQQDAAKVAAEARRQAAQRAYDGKVAVANQAKGDAKGQYDWLVNTLGSNKKDLLDQVTLNEKTGTDQYNLQGTQIKENYDKSRQEILTTYRDLNQQQEKILRGAGVSQSSRSQEAQLRLNDLMGKDMSQVSKGEADSLALIGNALATFQQKIVLTKNSIETEAKSKLDKAALDYDSMIKNIDVNLQLSANEREDAYAAAEAQLASDTANIKTWAAGVQFQAQQTIAQQKGVLDNFIVDMTSGDKLLNSDLTSKQQATKSLVDSISTSVTLDKEGNLGTPTQGVYKAAPARTLASLYEPQGVRPDGLSSVALGSGTMQQTGTIQNVSARQDPLLNSIFA